MTTAETNFFSISADLIITGGPVGYDLYVNSSSREGAQHFVRVFPASQEIREDDVARLRDKYHQLYVAEKDREKYLSSIAKSDRFTDVKKSEVIKEAAIQHLDNLFDPDKEFTTDVLNESLEGCRATVSAMVDVVQKYDIEGLQNHIAKLSFHDFYTYDHSINVSMYCIGIMKSVLPSATDNELITAGLGGLFHDIGKTKIPTSLLNKTSKLNDEEFGEIKKHPNFGMAILSENGVEVPKGVSLEILKRVVYEHHENFNGTGYPQNLRGEGIHVMARIAAIADFFDAITTKRSYHEALNINDAVALMTKSSGKKLDPKLFKGFTEHIEHMEEHTFHAELPDSFDPCQPQKNLPFQKAKPGEVTRLQSRKPQNPQKPKTSIGNLRAQSVPQRKSRIIKGGRK